MTFVSLCVQIKGLGELTEFDQMHVLRRGKPTSRRAVRNLKHRALLAVLITTDAGTMHPLYP